MAQDIRLNRRMVGMLAARLPEAQLDRVPDRRHDRGKQWPLSTLLSAVVVALCAGRKSLAETEALTAEMSPAVRRRLEIARRVPDTTLHDALLQVEPESLRASLHAQTKAAQKRKALEPDGLPFGQVAMDGKSTSTTAWDDHYCQKQTHSEGQGAHGMLRTVTCSLVSCAARACIDAILIPPSTNEMGMFGEAFKSLVATYSQLFQLVSYDAGACSEENGRLVVDHQLNYLFGLKGSQPTLLGEAQALLGEIPAQQAEAQTVDVESNRRTVSRRLYRSGEMAGFLEWAHLKTVLRVESVTEEKGEVIEREDRYFISSLPMEALSAAHWLLAIRRHWGVENNCHHTWDTVFEEDARPWVEKNPKGMLVVMLLRRMAYNLLALFRSVTQRSEDRRQTPWKDLVRWLYQALFSATSAEIDGLRAREAFAGP
jgi:predicted transposase YbfD/YdcC